MNKITKISEFQKGQKVVIKGDVTVTNKISSNGGRYKSLKVEDTSNIAYSTVFDNDRNFNIINKEKFYAEIECFVTSVKNETVRYNSFNLLSIKECDKSESESVVDINKLKEYLGQTIHDMKHIGYRQLLFDLFKNKEIIDTFFIAPGDELAGYSFKGGLLAKVVRLIKLSKAIVKVYNELDFNLDDIKIELNEDLLICACIFFEIGRVNQLRFTVDNRIEKTKIGNLFDTEHISNKILIKELDKNQILNEDEKMFLEHVTTSTLGKVESATKEAFAFSLLSLLDKKLSNFEFLERTSGKVEFAELFGKVMYLQSNCDIENNTLENATDF